MGFSAVAYVRISLFQQEPGANGTEIANMLRHVRPGNGFEPNFRMLWKTDVNGADEHPLYTYLKVQGMMKE